METLREYMLDELQKYEKSSGGRANQLDFANYLGVGRTTFSTWLNGTVDTLSMKSVNKVANKLGPKIYAVMGLNPPSTYLQSLEIQSIYDAVPIERRDELIETMRNWAAENDFIVSEVVDPPPDV